MQYDPAKASVEAYQKKVAAKNAKAASAAAPAKPASSEEEK